MKRIAWCGRSLPVISWESWPKQGRGATGPPRRRAVGGPPAEIVRLIQAGLSIEEIASRLCVEVATVKNQVQGILKKLQVRRRGEAAALARRSACRGPSVHTEDLEISRSSFDMVLSNKRSRSLVPPCRSSATARPQILRRRV
ncbi:MAG: hypothetical protein GTN62_07460 [Gemmatimonadales bacterium]|nr:hypothetical protein [Gemmatimonadales bacterium]NIP07401.1 hypothetical protein [Gemmatimonadales bacterium]NIQ99098.1 hypothetical protein [Gemmatimonadales bacterium]NIS63891.1 hypothetical protein [Gemmatimonadales bacterium]